MIETFRQLMIFIRFVGLIFANKSNFSRVFQLSLLRDYIKLKALCLIGWKNNSTHFLGHTLYFFDLRTALALIESIFTENEYFFETDEINPVIYDLGSNIGLSIIYFKFLYPQSIIHSFEADPTTFKILKKNVKSYSFSKVTLNCLAVSNKKGSIGFYTSKDGPGSPLMSTNPLRISNNKISVKCDKLSSHISGKVSFIKMDIEGSEHQVLSDLDSTKKLKYIDQLSIEYHHHINKDQDNLSSFLELLENNNYGYQIHAGQNTPFETRKFEDIQIHAYKKLLKSKKI